MEGIEFPIFKTKIDDQNNALGNKWEFDLSDVEQRKEYFKYKAGQEIQRLRDYLKENTFIAYLLGKKNSGKGTYAKMLREIVSPGKIEHFSIGDMVRELDEVVQNAGKKKELVAFLERNYRGFLPLAEIIKSLEERSTKVLLPSELILALVKKKISGEEKKALFIDGFPRGLDQVSYSLFFRDLIGYRDDPDIFVLIDVPESVIDARIKNRVVCPRCQTSRNLKLLPTKKVEYEKEKDKFFLICDNTECQGERMMPKEGDKFGIEPIRERLKTDEELIRKAFSLHGIPKILLRNSVPVSKAGETFDDYEITPEFYYKLENGEVKIKERPWQVLDDEGVSSYSLMPPPVVVGLIKQLVEALDI